MHFFAQIKPKCHIHAMWVAHQRRSAELDHVLFKINDDGIYESGELTDEQINRFRSRPEIVRLILTNISTADIDAMPHIPPREMTEEEIHAAAMADPDNRPMTPEELAAAPRKRPRLKE